MEQRQSHAWIEQFCVQLLRSRPDLPGRFVLARAIAAFPHAADLPPDEAARLLAAALPTTHSTALEHQVRHRSARDEHTENFATAGLKQTARG